MSSVSAKGNLYYPLCETAAQSTRVTILVSEEDDTLIDHARSTSVPLIIAPSPA